ncbi:M15 family metallopeptidase [Glutamicibacter arilaitensis]|uniref:Peptidase M15C domain-containing protein n=1 Tax=Glutamicibacter arilaitensis TaxID=256701 RepID=A0A2N7RZG4_9MICC|nr:M15 family metallopeptidase [Glutamicibacter arilaitensis]PMQ19268.1 hypothetical protein CIK84_11195 [Glutamicibacter arilaitensis]
MALTRLGWDVLTSGSSNRLTNLKWITGKVRAGDAHTILNELGRRFNAEVETIRKDWSWGYAYRPVRGASVASEHSAGTAVDFNAPAHGLGLSGTFSGAQVKAIRRILADLDGTVRWGGDYAGRKDEMHFELQGGVSKLARVAAKINGGIIKPVGIVKPSKPKPAKSNRPTDYKDLTVDGKFGSATAEATQILMSQIGLYERAIDGDAGKYTWEAVQEWLNGLGYYHRAVDGDFGYHSVIALQQFLAKKGHLDTKRWLIDGKFGPATVEAFQRYLNQQNGQ